jgi:large subunit ribosomal protein L13
LIGLSPYRWPPERSAVSSYRIAEAGRFVGESRARRLTFRALRVRSPLFGTEADFKIMFGKTHSTKTAEVEKKWLVIDAKGLVVGRLASIIALRLRGKHKASFTPHVDDGDNVIVVNADKVVFTGGKRDQKVYHHYTGYIGGIKERSAKSILEGRFPERIVEKAVERMLPRGPLGKKQLGNLRVYKGPDHPHAAQSPTVLDVAKLNPKNSRSAEIHG